MAEYLVTGAAVVLPTEGGSERYLYKGARIGDGYTAEGIKHAVSVGLIEKVKVEKPAEETAPEGSPSDKWTVPQLEAFAAEKKIDLTAATSKPEKLAAILAAPSGN